MTRRALGGFMKLTTWYRRIARDLRGNVLITFSIAAPLMLMIVGGALDYAQLLRAKSHLQAAADAAALGSARELYLADANDSRIASVADSIVTATLNRMDGISVKTDVPSDDDRVIVNVHSEASSSLLASVGFIETPISVSATARIVGGGRLCVIGLDPQTAGAVQLDKSARITAPTCTVYSNSRNSQGLKAMKNSSLVAELICTAGGKVGPNANFTPDPILDCPPVDDPLASRPAPDVGTCMEKGLTIEGDESGERRRVTLDPGTYCGGLTITGNVDVTLRAGVYVFDDGPLVVEAGAMLEGEYAGLYFTGKGAALHFGRDTVIDLSAPKNGPMAGILIWEDGASPSNNRHLIESQGARNLLGTIYIPDGRLEIISNGNVADRSAYTAIVAQRLTLDAGPNLYLNTDYDRTDVPVPAGVGPVKGDIILSK